MNNILKDSPEGLMQLFDCCLFESSGNLASENVSLIFESVTQASPDYTGKLHVEGITENGIQAIYEMPKKLDSNHVLGKFSGIYFILDGYSQNGRFYPAELWENTISSEKIQNRLKSGMLGTHTHPATGTQFEHSAFESHVIKGLQIDGKLGKGHSYILNTPMGNFVNTLFRAKDEYGKNLIEMFVSSRGYGRFIEGREKCPTVDPKRYILHTFDTVLTPGIAIAKVRIIESRASRLPQKESARLFRLLNSLKSL